jgi:hypothetical protein
MRYEPCTGRCYAYSDVMRIHTLGLTTANAAAFLERLVKIHEPSCGNSEIQFRLDADEFTRIVHWQTDDDEDSDTEQHTRFVASFYHYGSLDLFAADTPLEALNQMIDAALVYYESDQYQADLASRPGFGHDVCEHGDDKKLIEFAISFSGLGTEEQDNLRARFSL